MNLVVHMPKVKPDTVIREGVKIDADCEVAQGNKPPHMFSYRPCEINANLSNRSIVGWGSKIYKPLDHSHVGHTSEVSAVTINSKIGTGCGLYGEKIVNSTIGDGSVGSFQSISDSQIGEQMDMRDADNLEIQHSKIGDSVEIFHASKVENSKLGNHIRSRCKAIINSSIDGYVSLPQGIVLENVVFINKDRDKKSIYPTIPTPGKGDCYKNVKIVCTPDGKFEITPLKKIPVLCKMRTHSKKQNKILER